MIGFLIFLGLLSMGVFAWMWSQTAHLLPSKEAVLDFASDTMDRTPEVEDAIVGSMVPDAPTTAATSSNDVPTTLPALATPPREADWLTPSQRSVLAALGIDEASLPKTLTPELEACFVAAIGEDRVAAIKAGGTPSMYEGIKAMSCL
jgi:hypothetical protein